MKTASKNTRTGDNGTQEKRTYRCGFSMVETSSTFLEKSVLEETTPSRQKNVEKMKILRRINCSRNSWIGSISLGSAANFGNRQIITGVIGCVPFNAWSTSHCWSLDWYYAYKNIDNRYRTHAAIFNSEVR